ncbi:Rhodanese-like domain-containing protein [Mycena epipterygia]|nr:Rhodanese-like domain-containing protein [Mycena epipterygia]
MSKRSTSSVASQESILPDRSTQSSTLPQRTLDDVRDQVAFEVAVRTMTKGETVDGVRLGVTLTFSKSDDEAFLRRVAVMLEHQLLLQHHVFAIATTGPSTRDDPSANTLLICGAPEHYVQRAVLLASSKLLGRIALSKNDGSVWAAVVRDIGVSTYDEQALWDVVRKSARAPIDPLSPPPGSRGIDRILSDARARLQRLTPRQAYAELREPEVGAPTFLVDIRTPDERARGGGIHGSLIIERAALEWRFDPRCEERLVIVDRYDLRVIVFCEDGGASSLAALALQELGLLNATDIVGGYRAWKAAGLPVDDLAESTAPSVIEILD